MVLSTLPGSNADCCVARTLHATHVRHDHQAIGGGLRTLTALQELYLGHNAIERASA